MAKIEIEIDTSKLPEAEDDSEGEDTPAMKVGKNGRESAQGCCGKMKAPKGIVRGTGK